MERLYSLQHFSRTESVNLFCLINIRFRASSLFIFTETDVIVYGGRETYSGHYVTCFGMNLCYMFFLHSAATL